MSGLDISVVVSSHNPNPERLARALGGLRAQSLPPERWETLLIDNASSPAIACPDAGPAAPANLRLIQEPELGLTFGRKRGFVEAQGRYCVLVDDDNVLAPDYLANVVGLFDAHRNVGALGGKSLPEFEREPEPWQREFLPLLALRDLGDSPKVSRGLRPPGAARDEYPADCAPIGAGMALRREAVQGWLDGLGRQALADRRGSELSSSGDNDLVFAVLRAGWEVGYFPELGLSHLIPAARLEPDYLARLNRGIQKSWMQVLTRNGANPWPPIPRWSVPVRKAKAWLAYRAWSGSAARIRWQGVCGHFDGRA